MRVGILGAATVIDPALAAESALGATQERSVVGLEQRRIEVMRNNKSQIDVTTTTPR